jgi:hypothetical protein
MGRPAAKKAAAAPPTAPPADDPLADLREDDARYQGAEGPQGAAGAPDGPEVDQEDPNPLATLLYGLQTAAMGIMGEPTQEDLEMAQALATEAAADLEPTLTPVAVLGADEAVARWHADTVALGFLHKGGRCGCRYVAQVILGA